MIVRVSRMLISSMRTRTLRGPENQSSFKKTVEEYLATSSIHGLAQIGRYAVCEGEEDNRKGIVYLLSDLMFRPNPRCNGGVLNIVWFLIVALGFILTFLMAFLVRGDWSDTPTSTSVLQIPIEEIIFPAVTICPLGRESHV